MDNIQRILTQQPLLSGLDPAQMALIAPITRLVHFAPGSFVLRACDPADEFFLLTKGSVAVREVLRGEDGDCHLTIGTLLTGELLGASWLLNPRQWSHDVVAVEPVEALAIDVNGFLCICNREHSLGYRLMKAVGQVFARRLRETSLQLCDIYAG